MYGIFTYIYHRNEPNVGKYTIHGWYGIWNDIDPSLIPGAKDDKSEVRSHDRQRHRGAVVKATVASTNKQAAD